MPALIVGLLALYALPMVAAATAGGSIARHLWLSHVVAVAVLTVRWRVIGGLAGTAASILIVGLSAAGRLPVFADADADGDAAVGYLILLLVLEVIVALGVGALVERAKRDAELRRLHEENVRITEGSRSALAERERAWAEIMHEAADPIILVACDGTMLAFNPAAEQLTGLDAGAVIGAHAVHAGFIAPTSTGAALHEMERLLTGEQRPPVALEIEHVSGERRVMEAHSRAVWRDGDIVGVQAILRDVTARSELEARLRESEQRQRAVLDALDAAVIYQTADGVVTANPAAEQLLGIARTTLSAGTWHAGDRWLIDQHGHALAEEALPTWRALYLGETVTDELVGIQHADGAVVWLLANARPIIATGANRPHASVTSFIDITALRSAEESLRESEERFRGALEGGLDAFHIMKAVRDDNGTIVDFEIVALNAQAVQRFGREREEIVGHRMLELHPETVESGVFARHCAVVETGIPIDDEYPDPIRGRGHYWIRVQSIRLGDGVAVTARDVTTQRTLMAALAASEERLRGAIEAGLDAFIILTAVRDDSDRIIDFRIDDLNARAEQRFGIVRATAIGRRASDVSRVFDNSGIFDKHRRVVERGEPIDEIVLDYVPGREGRWVRHQIVKLGDGVAVTSLDVTVQKELEAALRDSEGRQRSVIAALEEGVMLHDDSGKVISCNASALAVLGIPEFRLVGSMPERWEAVREDGTAFPREMLPAMMTLRTGVPQTNVILGVQRGDGTRCWLSVNARPIYQDGETHPHAVVSSFTDITGRLQQERERRLLQELTLAIASADDVRSALRAALREVCEATGWEYGEALLLTSDGQQLEPAAIWHTSERLKAFADLSRTRAYPRGIGLSGRVWETGEPIWSDDVVNSPWFSRREAALQAELHSCLGVPVIVNGTLVAVLAFLFTQRHSRATNMLGPVVAVAAQIGSLIERKRAETALRESEALFRQVFDGAGTGMTLHDRHGRILQTNPALCEMFGYSAEEMITMDAGPIASDDDRPKIAERFEALLAGEYDSYQVEKRYRHRDGHVIWGLMTMSLIRDANGTPLWAVGQVQDISDHKQREAALAHHAFHDRLTGLPNRALYEDRLNHALARARRNNGQVGVMYIDLDGFKQVNDTLGHDAGDHLLVEAGQRIADCLRAADTVARFGGDEYTVLIEDALDIMGVALVAERVVHALRQPFVFGDTKVSIGASVGVALSVDASETGALLLKRADAALYEAKHNGKGRYVLDRPGAQRVLIDAGR